VTTTFAEWHPKAYKDDFRNNDSQAEEQSQQTTKRNSLNMVSDPKTHESNDQKHYQQRDSHAVDPSLEEMGFGVRLDRLPLA
jgi:hypothetical protein